MQVSNPYRESTAEHKGYDPLSPSSKYFLIVSVMKHGETDATDLAVFACLLDHASNGSGKAWPRQATVAREVGLSRATVGRSVAKLKRLGLLHVIRRRGRAAVYTFSRTLTHERSRTLTHERAEPMPIEPINTHTCAGAEREDQGANQQNPRPPESQIATSKEDASKPNAAFRLSESDRSYAAANGLEPHEIEEQADALRDYRNPKTWQQWVQYRRDFKRQWRPPSKSYMSYIDRENADRKAVLEKLRATA